MTSLIAAPEYSEENVLRLVEERGPDEAYWSLLQSLEETKSEAERGLEIWNGKVRAREAGAEHIYDAIRRDATRIGAMERRLRQYGPERIEEFALFLESTV